MLQIWVAASLRQQFSCTMEVEKLHPVKSRGGVDLLQHMQDILAELGFQDGSVIPFGNDLRAKMTAKWTSNMAASTSPQPIPAASAGACASCPICHENRPAVVVDLVLDEIWPGTWP